MYVANPTNDFATSEFLPILFFPPKIVFLKLTPDLIKISFLTYNFL